MNISIFGSSHLKEGDTLYTEAYNLGKELARAGHAILCGGYIGIMEAVSHGAYDANGRVIGVTCLEIEKWRTIKPNRWLEVALAWNMLIINAIPLKPLILIGNEWKSILEHFYTLFQGHIPQTQYKLLQFIPNIEEAIKIINNY